MAPLHSFQVCSPAEELQPSQGVCNAQRVRRKQKTVSWKLCTWNLRSMVNTMGSVEIASQGTDNHRGEERKVNLVVDVLKRYDVKVAALQETKWFGSEVYQVDGSVVLTAGRKTPQEGEAVIRGEGVAVVLLGSAKDAWKRGGSQWTAWSSRVVSVCLQLGKGRSSRLHVVSCYAPTRAASRELKDAFFQELGNVLSRVPQDERYVLMGDLNARVGSREHVGDVWDGVRGPHGYGAVNDAGAELLSFLSAHQATVCNTWFMKKDIHKQTWMHPRSQQWSCIDYIITRQRDRRLCLDVCVRRGAECNTDHQMLCATLNIGRCGYCKGKRAPDNRRYDVKGLEVGVAEESDVRVPYVECVLEKARTGWPVDGSVEEKWGVLRSAMTGAADEVLGKARRRNPDWFVESKEDLKPLLQRRNDCYRKWLATGRNEDMVRFREVRSAARKAIREAKNRWFQSKAEEAERERFSGKKVWRCIRDMQCGRRGLRPTRVVTIEDEDGELCTTKDAQRQRWRRHFTNVLNLRTTVDSVEMESVRQREVRDDLDSSPTQREIFKALGKLKNGKAAGTSGILPEMLKAGRANGDFLRC